MYCKSCGMTLDETFEVCALCGTKRGEGSTFCSYCGAVRQVGADSCQQCGSLFAEQDSSQPVTPPSGEQVSFSAPFDFRPEPEAAPDIYETEAAPDIYETEADKNPAAEEPVITQNKVFCRGCGHELIPGQTVCPNCGTKKGEGNAFCKHCGAPTEKPDAPVCPKCGKSLSESFDFGRYMSKFAENITGVFKNPGFPGMVFDFGPYFLSIIMLILALLPCVTVAQGAYTYFEYSLINIFAMTGPGGFLVVIAFLFSIARFVPHVDDYINKKNPHIGKFAIFIVPALDLLATISLFIHMFFGSLNIGTGADQIQTYYSLAFLGWIFVLLTLANIALALLSMLRGMGKIKI